MHDTTAATVALCLIAAWGGIGLLFLYEHVIKKAVGEFWRTHSKAAKIVFIAAFAAIVAIGGTKPQLQGIWNPTAVAPPTPVSTLSTNQCNAGFALISVLTDIDFAADVPAGAVVHTNWLLRGASRDAFRIGTNDLATAWAFKLGTNFVDHIVVSSRGTISFGEPFDRATGDLPDPMAIDHLAPFHAVLGMAPQANWGDIPATNSLFWYDVTDVGSLRLTWLNALYNRAADKPVSFQAELYPSGDFRYRYDFGTTEPTNYVIGAQNNGGGESWTEEIPDSRMELRWTHFESVLPGATDTDGDGLTDYEEVYTYHTDPACSDSDGDGLADGEDDAPNNCDADSDGMPDGVSASEWSLCPLLAENAGFTNLVLTIVQGMDSLPTNLPPLRMLLGANNGEEDGEQNSAAVSINGYTIPARVGSTIQLGLEHGVFYPYHVYVRGNLKVLVYLASTDGVYIRGDGSVFDSGTAVSSSGEIALPIVYISPVDNDYTPCVHEIPGYRDFVLSVMPLDRNLSQSSAEISGFTDNGDGTFRLSVEDSPPSSATGTAAFCAPTLASGRAEASVTIHRCQYDDTTHACEECVAPWHNTGGLVVDIEEDSYIAKVDAEDRTEVALDLAVSDPNVVWCIDSTGDDGPLLYSSATGGTGSTSVVGGTSVWVDSGSVPGHYTITARHAQASDVFDTADFYAGKASIRLFAPPVFNARLPELLYEERMSVGGAVFVNLDNDDGDGAFDYDGVGAHDSEVVGGDNELAQVMLEVEPSDLPITCPKLEVPSGASNIVLWGLNTKRANTRLPSSGQLSVDCMPSGATNLWVEGIVPHTMQRETTLKFSFNVGDITFEDEAKMTVVGIQSVSWVGKNNSVNDSSELDNDPNWPLAASGLSAVRVFPGARAENGVVGQARDKVDVRVQLTVGVPFPINVYLQSFDMDDPTADNDAVDDETSNGDNRGRTPASTGVFSTSRISSCELRFQENEDCRSAEFQTTMQPGDNFRVVASCDFTYLSHLSNPDNTVQAANGTNEDKQRILCETINGTFADQEIRLPQNYASPVLAVWRFLHMEVDSMEAPPANGAEKNFVEGTVVAIVGDGLVAKGVYLNKNLESAFSPADNSWNMSTPSSTDYGRFENGQLVLGSGANITTISPLDGNSSDAVWKDNGMRIPFRIVKNGLYDITGEVVEYDYSYSAFVVTNLSSSISNGYVGGTITVAGIPNTISAISYPTSVHAPLIALSTQNNIPFRLHDDDNDVLLPHIPQIGAEFNTIYNSAYIHAVVDGGNSPSNNTQDIPFSRNVGTVNVGQFFSTQMDSDNFRRDSFWIAYVVSVYQSSPGIENWGGENRGDKDPNSENALGGLCYDFSKTAIFREEMRDAGWLSEEERTIAHEVGHQFKLPDDYGNSHIMGNTTVPGLRFRSDDLDRIRTNPHSPGRR